MTGYRDSLQDGAHIVHLEVDVPFGEDGVCWSPTPQQQNALAANPQRRARFQLVEHAPVVEQPPQSAPQEALGPEPAPADPTGPTNLAAGDIVHVEDADG